MTDLRITAQQALEALSKGTGWMEHGELITALRAALAQPDVPDGWVPVTQELLNAQPDWIYEPMWISLKNGPVVQGHYEWRQGHNPDRIYTNCGEWWAFDAAFFMPLTVPAAPKGGA